MSYKVFLVEDEIVTREGIRDKVGWQAHGFEFCGEAPDGEIALPLLQRLKIDIDVTRTLGDYSVAIQQMAAIVRALEVSSAKILILDEPTSPLDAKETAQLFDVMRRLQSEGVGIVFITHFMDQVYEVADRITVLRNGKLVGTYDTASLPRLELIRKMIGRSLTEFDDMSKIKLESAKNIQGPLVLEAEGLGRTGSLEPIDLKLHAGEVVGLAGLLGSGRSEVAGLLFGVEKPDSGSAAVGGKPIRDYSPLASIKRGVALCPEDRKAEGIVGEDGTNRIEKQLTAADLAALMTAISDRGWFTENMYDTWHTPCGQCFGYYLTVVHNGQQKTVKAVDGGTDAPADYWQVVSILNGAIPHFVAE
jgi:ABC-type sugar transport system ATPase subunit